MTKGRDCAWCRNSQAPSKKAQPFVCKLGKPMDATSCSTFRDSRQPLPSEGAKMYFYTY